MTSPRYELEAWLGPALDDLTPEQIDRLEQESRRIAERYPDPDDQDLRDAALSAATQYLLGETTLDDAGQALVKARTEEACASAAAQQLAAMAVADGMQKKQAAERACIDRMTLYKVLGMR